MGKQQRAEAVASLAKRLSNSNGLIVCDYTGLKVEQINGLRRQVRAAGSELKVAKNTLLRIAVKDTGYETVRASFTGQTAVTFIDNDPALAAKVITTFLKDILKENPDCKFKIRSGVIQNQVLNDLQIDQLGNLPSREVLLGQLVGLLASPLSRFVTVLSDIPGKFLRTLTAVAEQKRQQT